MRRSALSLLFLIPLSVQACPDLQPFYLLDSSEQAMQLEVQLGSLMSECLNSSEFFALYGAAQMDVGKLAEALETLERALLLDPDNGAAQIDYAQALYSRGQLFSALDLNDQTLQRQDLPPDIQVLLQERRQQWRRQTRQRAFHADVLAGYDNNLNGAPDPSQITLTIAGEPVILTLNEEYRPISGPYLNLRAGGQYRQLASDHQHSLVAELRGRASQDSPSDLLQFESHYIYTRPRRDHTWQFDTGLSHLLFGGSPLYTAAEGGALYQTVMRNQCVPGFRFTAQYQLYHNQSNLNSIESRASAGLDCPLSIAARPTLIGGEISVLNSKAVNDGRPGGGRDGWQLKLSWQFPLLGGVLDNQLHHAHLRDRTGYSPLLDNGAERWLGRTYLLMQYRQPLLTDISLVVNFYHQYQRSNIELFDSLDTTFEVGISAAF
ncbi:MAG: tetratricopeptide repeat protein [Gammaproteobacteria bacterium]|nr:tetratricopeptide repeat protein [Gammaproteobacteria bacterium]MDP2348938.1 tetratricopeptide repeat protein [Gammaproteobacteria bacterium]